MSKALVHFLMKRLPTLKWILLARRMAVAEGAPAQTSPSSDINFSHVICLKKLQIEAEGMRQKRRLSNDSSLQT